MDPVYESIVEALLASGEPAVRWKIRSRVLDELTESPQMTALREKDGWPAHARFYCTSTDIASHHDCADWGGTSTRRANQWVTADALTVLHAAGRLHC
jgi:hypothetical protein